MRRFSTVVALFTAGLASLILATATPASADGPTGRYRIADIDSRTFATASSTTRLVTMQPPSTVVGPQHWVFSDTTLGTRVANAATGGCLGIPTTWSTVYPPIVQEPCDNRSTEYWRIVSSTTDVVIFRNVGRDGCMAVDPSSTTARRLYLVPCQNDDRNQHFRLVA